MDSNLKTLIKERQKEIVGWYRFRPHSSLRVSLRETAVHRSLLQTLGIPQTEHFVFLLTTTSATSNLSTHSYDHVIYKLTSSTEFTSMSLSVINLGDTTHSQYKHHSAIVTPTGAGRYQSVIKRFESQFHDDTGGIKEVGLIQELAANLISQLEKISLLVSDEEKQLEELEKEVEKYEQVAKQLNNRPKSGQSPLSQVTSQNSGIQDEEANPIKQHTNRESMGTDKERLITDFLNNTESEHKIQLEVHLTKSQQGNNPSGLFGGDNFMSSSSSTSLTQPTQNCGESLLHQLTDEEDANLSVPLKPSTIATCNNNAVSGNKKSGIVRGDVSSLSALTTTAIKSVGIVDPKKPALAPDHFSFVENVLKEAKEMPEMINGEDSLQLDNCVTVPVGAQLQSPPGIANMCSQMSAKNSLRSKNDSLPESANSNTNAVSAVTSSGGTRRRTRSRSDQQQQQQQSVSTTAAKPSIVTRSYSPLSARNASPSPTPTTVASSGTDSGSSSPRHMRTRTPQSRGAPVTTASTRESRIDSNRSSTSKADSLNKEVQKSPSRRCRPSRPKERTLSSSNSPSRREATSIDYSSVRCERSVSPFF